jgi:tRNA G46 methylase TrmB
MTRKNLSSPVRTTQITIHPRLPAQVKRHLESDWCPVPDYPTVEAFEALERLGLDPHKKIILDSGCGTGESTRLIAARFPDCLVIGIDRSAARLGKLRAASFPHREGNMICLRAELSGFWWLALKAGWKLHRHFLLYPNPWPKPAQFNKRWHAHPVFPTLLRLGGRLELRCNWEIYAREFALAVHMATGTHPQFKTSIDGSISSPFERKYSNSGHDLYSVITAAL